MILFLTLLWVLALFLLVKVKLIKLNIWWKLSPVFWSIFLLITLFVPLQFWAPSGSLVVANYTVAIVPQVAGEVVEVVAKPNQVVNKGELLFRIDSTPYQATFDDAEAALKLANIRLAQEQTLLENNVGKQFNLDRALAQVAQNQARLELAEFNLKSTNVFAPAQGYATNIALRPGARVVAFPFAPSLSFVDTSERIVGGFVLQNHLRYIEPGQKVEVALKMYPGQVFEAIVDNVVPARATGFETITGLPVVPQELQHAPFAVKIKLSDEMSALNLPAGASGRMVIYSEEGGFAHVIRKVEIRIESIMNYINPF